MTELIMTKHQTQANLALFIGETYCEIEARDLDNNIIFSKDFFLPQSSLKNSLNLAQAEILKSNHQILNTYVVCKYLERLKAFRLGGSVIQITQAGLENNYMLENTNRFSLAAASLIISIDIKTSKDNVKKILETEFERLRKINPEANKVVIHLSPSLFKQNVIDFIVSFFESKDFKIFMNQAPQELSSIRKALLNAGTEGTKEEICKEIQEIFKGCTTYFWIDNEFKTEFENYQLYFSSDDFLGSVFLKNAIEKVVLLDIENWMVLENKLEPTWDSPWGNINRKHYSNTRLTLHPLTEILLDENTLLKFSKNPASSEPGPMTAGRGVKSLILDLFYSDFKKNESMIQLFPALENKNTENKISSQFKVLEHSQKSETKNLLQADIKQFITELISFDINRLGCHSKNSITIGHLSFLKQENKTFRWTNEIFKMSQKIKAHDSPEIQL